LCDYYPSVYSGDICCCISAVWEDLIDNDNGDEETEIEVEAKNNLKIQLVVMIMNPMKD
jgi:hypothetical protein